MNKISIIVFLLLIFKTSLFSQYQTDTVRISRIEISAKYHFNKDEAGMKSILVDTLILQQKVDATLSQILSENTSVFIKNHGRGALSTASFRGTAASHTQVNWNGININSPMAGMVDFSLIPVFLIDEMKLNFGGASLSENNGGLGGSININNSANWNDKFSLKLTQSIGSYRTFEDYFQINIGSNRIKSKTRLYFNYSKNDFTFINRGIANFDTVSGEFYNPLDTNDNANYKMYGVLQEFYFKPNTKSIFSLKWWGQNAFRTIPRATSYEGPDNSNRNLQTDFDNKIVLDWKHYSLKNKFLFLSGFSFKKLTYELKNNIVGLGFVPVIYSDSYQKSSYNKFIYTYFFNDDFSLNIGLNADIHWVETIDTVKDIGYNQKREEISGFVSIKKNFYDKINLNLLVRQSLFGRKFAPITPFLGIDYKPFSKHQFVLRGNISRNHHLPSLNDLYWQPGGNPYLLPESGISEEFGVEYYKISKKNKFSAEVSVYKSDIKNWIIWLPSYQGYWEPKNISRVLSKGIELTANMRGNFGQVIYNFSGSYAYTSSKNYGDINIWGEQAYGKQLVYVPKHSGNFMVNFYFKGFYVTYQHNSYSERFTTSSNDITKRDWLYPYFMNDLFVGKTINFNNHKISISVKSYNLLNETYHSILYRPMPKRNYMLTLSFI